MAWDKDEQAGEASTANNQPEHSRQGTLEEELLDVGFTVSGQSVGLVLAEAENCQDWIHNKFPANESVGTEEERDNHLIAC